MFGFTDLTIKVSVRESIYLSAVNITLFAKKNKQITEKHNSGPRSYGISDNLIHCFSAFCNLLYNIALIIQFIKDANIYYYPKRKCC